MASTQSTRRFAVLGGLGALVVLAILFAGEKPRAAAAVRVPTDPAEVLETLVSGNDPRAKQAAELRQALATNPKDLGAALALAKANIGLSRAHADPRYLGQAQAVLAPWWVEDAPAPVLVLRATIEQSLHDFDSALRHLDAALKQQPNNAQAWVTKAVIQTVRAEYESARESCAEVAALAGELTFAVCDTQIDSLNGKAQEAYSRLSKLLDLARSPEEKEWAVSSMGEYAARFGDVKTAEEDLIDALNMDPNDAYARGVFADLLLDVGRNQDVIKLLEGMESDDAMLLRLTIAEHRMRGPKLEEHREILASRFEASHARGDVVHRREEARFRLELERDPEGALKLAQANWQVQKEPWDVRVFLAAATMAHDKKAAAPVLAHVEATHLQEPVVESMIAGLK